MYKVEAIQDASRLYFGSLKNPPAKYKKLIMMPRAITIDYFFAVKGALTVTGTVCGVALVESVIKPSLCMFMTNE